MLCFYFIEVPFAVSSYANVRINVYKGLKIIWNQNTKHSIHHLLNKRTIKDIVDDFFLTGIIVIIKAMACFLSLIRWILWSIAYKPFR